MDEEVLGVYGAPDSDFCAPNMASSYLRLTDSAATTAESRFHPRPCPGMYSGGTASVVAISRSIIHHPFFYGASPCHYVSYGCLATVPSSNLSVVVGRIFCKWGL